MYDTKAEATLLVGAALKVTPADVVVTEDGLIWTLTAVFPAVVVKSDRDRLMEGAAKNVPRKVMVAVVWVLLKGPITPLSPKVRARMLGDGGREMAWK